MTSPEVFDAGKESTVMLDLIRGVDPAMAAAREALAARADNAGTQIVRLRGGDRSAQAAFLRREYERMLKEGSFEEAILFLSELCALDRSPKHVLALGSLLLRTHRFAEAYDALASLFSRSAALAPDQATEALRLLLKARHLSPVSDDHSEASETHAALLKQIRKTYPVIYVAVMDVHEMSVDFRKRSKVGFDAVVRTGERLVPENPRLRADIFQMVGSSLQTLAEMGLSNPAPDREQKLLELLEKAKDFNARALQLLRTLAVTDGEDIRVLYNQAKTFLLRAQVKPGHKPFIDEAQGMIRALHLAASGVSDPDVGRSYLLYGDLARYGLSIPATRKQLETALAANRNALRVRKPDAEVSAAAMINFGEILLELGALTTADHFEREARRILESSDCLRVVNWAGDYLTQLRARIDGALASA